MITYSPLLLATDAGLAAATAELFSLTGTTLQQKSGEDLYHVQGVYCMSVHNSHIYSGVFAANSRCGGILAFCTAVQTLLLNSKHRNGPVGWRAGQWEKYFNHNIWVLIRLTEQQDKNITMNFHSLKTLCVMGSKDDLTEG